MRTALLGLLALSLFGQNVARLPAGASPGKGRIADVVWMAGQWTGEGLGGVTEETWSQPAGGAMMGMFRVVHGTETDFYELMQIVESNGSLILRLKHFGPDLKGWEEKDKTVDFPLVRIDDAGAWFDGVTYRKNADGTMTSWVAIRGKDGKTTDARFAYRRLAEMKPIQK